MKKLEIIALQDFPLIKVNDDIGDIINSKYSNLIENNDILVIAQKIISKAENRFLDLNSLNISSQANKLASKTGRAPKLCQAIIENCSKIIKTKGKVIVTELSNGMIVTSSGIDKSNIDTKNNTKVILLPKDSDKSAKKISLTIKEKNNIQVAVIINDSLGHPYRGGSIGKAIGLYGIKALETPNSVDLNNNISNPIINLVDELASAASILMGQANQGVPVVLIKGAKYTKSTTSSINEIIIKQI